MPWLFWLEVGLLSFSAVIAASLVLVVVGAGPRRPLNLCFALFLLAEACASVFDLLLHLALWLGRGNPPLLIELCALSYILAGPLLLMFTVRYVGRRGRLADAMSALGLVIAAFLCIPLFRHQLVVNPRLSVNGTTILDLRPPAYAVALMLCVYLAFSLVLFWRERKRTGEPYLAVSVATLLAGFVVGGILVIPYPVIYVTNSVGIGILGYGVLSRQIFNPLRELAERLERKVEDRTRELKNAYAEVERRVEERTAELSQEIADRQRAEEALRKSEGRYRTLTESAQDAIFIIDREDRVEYLNSFAAGMFGRTPEKIVGQPRSSLFPREIALQQHENLQEVFRTGETMRQEGRMAFPDREIWLETSLVPLRDEAGEVRAVLGVSRDVTDRKRAEEAYRTLVDQSLHGIAVVQEGRIVFANSAFAEISAYTVEELLAMSPEQAQALKHPNDRPMVLGYYHDRLAGKPAPTRYEYRLLRKDGKVRWVDVAVRVIEYREEPAVQVIYADITERKELEERLLRAQKLESIGTLAAGVAHNFNNILTAVLGNAQLARFKLKESSPAAKPLDAVIRAAMRAAQLAKQLLATARRTPGERTVIRSRDLVHGLAEGMLVMLDSNIQLEHSVAQDLPTVIGDPVELEQALLNICVNARDAMPRGGTIHIEAAPVELAEPFCAAHENMSPGRYVCISVTDSGIGMDNDTMAGMFDPFFTTKGPDRGTGLGLSSAYGTVVSHGGCIEAESEVGKGSTFRVYLPAAAVAEAETEEEKSPTLEKGDETLLVVDDETELLDMLREGLESLGYTVRTAIDGEEAVEMYERDGQRIDLIVLDYMMPGMDGEATCFKLRQIDPGVRILLSSGYDERTKLGPLLDAGVDGFIQKPYEMPELSVAIRTVLSRAKSE
ncbi:MAG: PAS domain S-box protein [Planctomycetes bacterium]|nr:PAS domain S-box protein [Planctomycetota bacterium]